MQVVGVLEDGKTYATELVQSRKPGQGAVAQWEHELVSYFHLRVFTIEILPRRNNGVEMRRKNISRD